MWILFLILSASASKYEFVSDDSEFDAPLDQYETIDTWWQFDEFGP